VTCSVFVTTLAPKVVWNVTEPERALAV